MATVDRVLDGTHLQLLPHGLAPHPPVGGNTVPYRVCCRRDALIPHDYPTGSFSPPGNGSSSVPSSLQVGWALTSLRPSHRGIR